MPARATSPPLPSVAADAAAASLHPSMRHLWIGRYATAGPPRAATHAAAWEQGELIFFQLSFFLRSFVCFFSTFALDECEKNAHVEEASTSRREGETLAKLVTHLRFFSLSHFPFSSCSSEKKLCAQPSRPPPGAPLPWPPRRRAVPRPSSSPPSRPRPLTSAASRTRRSTRRSPSPSALSSTCASPSARDRSVFLRFRVVACASRCATFQFSWEKQKRRHERERSKLSRKKLSSRKLISTASFVVFVCRIPLCTPAPLPRIVLLSFSRARRN